MADTVAEHSGAFVGVTTGLVGQIHNIVHRTIHHTSLPDGQCNITSSATGYSIEATEVVYSKGFFSSYIMSMLLL